MRATLLAAALTLAGMACAAPPALASDASDLAQRYVAWRGGPAFETLKSLHEKGTLTASGLHGTAEQWLAKDGRALIRFDLGAVKGAEALENGKGWTLTENGQVEDLAPREVEDVRRDLALAFATALEDPKRLSLGPDAQRDGKTWKVLKVDFGDADAHELYIDPRTGELDGVRTVRDRKALFTRYSDWRPVNGVKMPFREDAKGDVAQKDTLTVWTAVETDPVLTAALFERPATIRRATFAGGRTSTDWITFDLFAGNRLFLPVSVNGSSVGGLLDSAAETVLIDKAFARELKLKAAGDLPTLGTGGVETAQLASGVTLKIGDLELHDLTVAVIDLSDISRRIGHPIPIILGKPVFANAIVDADFPRRRIALRAPEGFAPPPGATKVELTSVSGIRSVPASIEGKPTVDFDFDLGNGSPLIVFASYWGPEKLLEGRRWSTTPSGGIGGVRESRIATVKSFTFAGQTFHDVPAVFPEPGVNATGGDRTLGNIGLPILARFRVISDFPEDRLWLVPDPEAVALPFPKDRMGLQLVREGRNLKISFVAVGSPADGAGLKAGQLITAIDGSPPEAWPPDRLRSLSMGEKDAEVELALAGGRVVRLKLQDYF